jgi:hypothetical protein
LKQLRSQCPASFALFWSVFKYVSDFFLHGQAAQRLVDEQERQFKEAQRQQIIERAQKIIAESDDGVKQFKSSLMLADAVKVSIFNYHSFLSNPESLTEVIITI